MKITVEFDTVTKKGTFQADGKEIENLSNICFYPSYYDGDGKWSMEVRQSEFNKEEGTSKHTSTYASVAGVLFNEN